MKMEKLRSKLKKALNRVKGVLLLIAILIVSCGMNAFVVRAAEKTQTLIIVGHETAENFTAKTKATFYLPEGEEIVAVKSPVLSGDKILGYTLSLYGIKNNVLQSTTEYFKNSTCLKIVDNKSGHHETTLTGWGWTVGFPFTGESGSAESSSFEVTSGNLKIFSSLDDVKKYASTGSGNYDIIKPDELEKGWYLKNVSYKVTADDSPSSEAGADATYIHFLWDIDNLQDGDLLEIKTKSYYKKILGEQLSGFHDFITKSDGVSAYEGKYSFSQYEATKAWFNSLENKPLVFKEYDTTDYYLRPYRQGQYGGWVHIKMGRSTPTSSPYIEDIEYGDFDDDNNWTVDEDLTDKNGGHHGVDQGGGYIPPDQSDNPFTGTNIAGIFSYFYDFMKQIPAMLGDLPALVGNIISFLPKPIIAFIGIGVIVAIILRIVGR